jgi:mono/diheme cytochrome c family protein
MLGVVVGILVLVAGSASGGDFAEAKKTFNQRCTACHTFGKGVKVGPDLKGVGERRERAWLIRFIRSSQSLIKSGDPVAVGLFREFKQERMPDWTDLSEPQIDGILQWLAANGPEQKEPDERNAEVASPAEIEMGRSLFHGQAPLANGGAACSTCHGIHDAAGSSAGSLGPELTQAYFKYQDRALTLFLRHPCFQRKAQRTSAPYLTPRESFAIKSYLRQRAAGSASEVKAAASMGAQSAASPSKRGTP